MNEVKTPETGGSPPAQPAKLDLDVKVYPSQREGNLLATANVTLGGCFAVKGLRVMDSKKGPFVAMPDWKDSKGERHDICFPTTKEMREALDSAVMGAYQRTVEKIAARSEQAMQRRPSVLEGLKEKMAQVAERPAAPKRAVNRETR